MLFCWLDPTDKVWQSLTKSYFIRSFQAVRSLVSSPTFKHPKMYPFPENLKKKNKWNILELTISPPPPARCDVLKGSRLWMPENEVIQVAVFQNNHRTAKHNRDFPKRIFHKIGISSTRDCMVCWKPLETHKEKLAQETLMYKAFTENFGTAWGTSPLSATTAIHIDRWRNIYAKITLPFPAHVQNLQKFIAFFLLSVSTLKPSWPRWTCVRHASQPEIPSASELQLITHTMKLRLGKPDKGK